MRSQRVLGVILGFERGGGVILCRHRKFATVNEAVDEYIRHPDKIHWCVGFDLGNLDEKSIKSAYAELTKLKANRKMKSGRILTLSDVMVGRIVTCKVEKSTKWSADSVKFARDTKRLWIPCALRKQKSATQLKKKNRTKSKPAETRFTRRIAAAAKAGSNLRRPWRG